MEDRQKKNSDAKIKANNKYRKQHYSTWSIAISQPDKDFLDNLAKSLNISKAQMILKAMHYIADNTIDIVNYDIKSNSDNTE